MPALCLAMPRPKSVPRRSPGGLSPGALPLFTDKQKKGMHLISSIRAWKKARELG